MLNVKIILLFFILGFFFLTFRILDVPPGINGDEAAIGYNAALVARTGRDQSGRFLPLFISTFNLTDWKQPITFYTTVLAFKLFGPSYYALRAVSVVILLISGAVIFVLTKEILGIKAGLLSLFIFLTIPSVLIQSHLALENIAPVPFIAGWLLSLTKYQKTPKIKYLILGGLFLGISLFSYPGMRLVVPVMSVLSLGFIWYFNGGKFMKVRRHLIIFFLTLIPFAILMFSLKNIYPGAILAYNRPQTISSYQEFFQTYLSSFDWSFLFLKGDATPYHLTGLQGVFLLATMPLFIIGLVKIFIQKKPILYLTLFVFFLTPALFGLTGTGSIYRSSRMLAFLPSFTVIATLGVITLSNVRNKFRIISLILITGLIALNYIDFLQDYWFRYPTRVKSEFNKPMHLAFEKARILSKKEHLKPYIEDTFPYGDEIATKFFVQVYFPDGLDKFKIGEQLPPQSVLLTGSNEPSNQQNKLQRYDVGTEFFSVFVNR